MGYVHGLFLDGATWSKGANPADGCLVESEPKKLFTSLPVLYVTGLIKTEAAKVRKEMFGALGPHEAACYKYASRGDRFRVFYVNLKCAPKQDPKWWIIRGVALMCNTD